MKLYTEEQLITCYNKGLMDAKNGIIDDNLLYGFLYIELPSEEEIENYANETLVMHSHSGIFVKGSKWVIEQIKQQVIP